MDQERRKILLAGAATLTLPALTACGGGSDNPPVSANPGGGGANVSAGPPYQLKMEKDVRIPMRDGSYIMANIFRPDAAGTFPVIMSISPYPKDVAFKDWPTANYDRQEIKDPLMHWESPPPTAWVSRGYVQIVGDQRGSGVSPGKLDTMGPQVQQDYYDAIEWAGVQAWSNGNVGTIGESYMGAIQWLVAQLNPPHLKALMIAQGFSDMFRDSLFHGGIFSARFLDFWYGAALKDYQYGGPKSLAPKLSDAELAANCVFPKDFRLLARELRSATDRTWVERTPDLSKIKAAVFAYANNGGFGLHLKGTIEGFQGVVNAPYRQLHTGIGFDPDALYRVADVEKQQRFMDRFLKGIAPAQPDALVDISVRTSSGVVHRTGTTYPLGTTSPQVLRLDAAGGGVLSATTPQQGSITYAADYASATTLARFATAPLTDDLELIGPARLSIWVESDSGDADLFVALREIRPDGSEVTASGAQDPALPVSMGWQKASRRNVDALKSNPYRAWLTEDRSEALLAGTPVLVEVNIWPIAWRLTKGNRLVLEIGGSEQKGNISYSHPPAGPAVIAGTPLRNGGALPGNVTLWTGGTYDSRLTLPVNAAG